MTGACPTPEAIVDAATNPPCLLFSSAGAVVRRTPLDQPGRCLDLVGVAHRECQIAAVRALMEGQHG